MPQHTSIYPQGGIRRGPRLADNFTILSNAVVNDRRLSFRARGVLIYLLSKPADWRTRSESIAAQSDKDGRDSVRSAMREMEALGYLMRNRVQDDRGRWHMIQTIFEDPVDTSVSPGPEKSSTGGTDVEKSGAKPRIDPLRTDTNQPSREAADSPANVEPQEEVVVVDDPPKIDKPNTEQVALIDELAAASQKAGLTATFRYLKPHNITEIAALVETHGVPKLVAHAKALHNSVNPTRYASGWIPMWKEMPLPKAALNWESCGECDPNGWVETDDGSARRRCHCHPRSTWGQK